jgi:N-acetylneuraminic acid mutarotase
VAGGLVAGDQSTARSYRIDLRNGQATALPDLPVPVHDVGGAVVNGRSEVIGGGNATEQEVVQAASTNSSWRVSGRLPSPRSDLVALVAGDRVFVVGGYDGTTAAMADILVSTSGRPFRVFGQLRVPVRYAAAAVSQGAIWVFGGESGGAELSVIQRIDLHTGRTRIAGRLPGSLGHASAVTFGSQILLIGGRTTASSSSATAAMWWFRPGVTPPTMRRAGTLPFPLSDSALARAAGAVYLVGGETPGLSARVLRITYDRGG